MRSLLPRALLVVLAVVILVQTFIIAPRADAIVLLAVIAWMVFPGVVLARAACPVAGSATIVSWLLGPALGLAFSVLGTFLWWAAGVQNWFAIALGPLLTLGVAYAAWRTGGLALDLPAFDRRDVLAVTLTLFIVPAITWAPYDHVRQPIEEGEAYRAYFTADFVWAMTVTAELAKGDVPPQNPFVTDHNLHYYWMAHFLSGAVYRNVAAWGISTEQVILINGIAFGLAFVAFFYALIRTAGASAAFAAVGVAVGFLANSYEGLNRLLWLRESGEPLASLRNINIDAVTRWYYRGMPVDGLQRLLLYQPHHLTGYMTALGALWVVARARRIADISVAVCVGTLLAMTFLFSTFTAVLVGAAVAVLFAIRLVSVRNFAGLIMSGLLSGGIAVIGALLTRILVYTDPRGGLMINVGLNPVALRQWPLVLLLSFGPLLIAGLLGLLRWRWVWADGAPLALLVAVSIAFYFLIDVPDMEGVWVGWRSGHQLLVAFAAIGAAASTALWKHRRARLPLVISACLLLIPAVPTVAIDVYNAQDIANRSFGPSFYWTLVVRPEEREALDWLKHSTPSGARVQFDAHFRGAGHWALIPAFAERRMAAGQPIAMIPFDKYRDATQAVRSGIFLAATPEDAYVMASYLRIDYIYIGDIERRYYRPLTEAITARQDLFPTAFRNAAVTILAVRPKRQS